MTKDKTPATVGVDELPLAERCALFVDMALERLWDGGDLEGCDIQDEALRLGLIVTVPFSSEKHDDHLGVGVEDGEDWNVPAPDYRALVRAANTALLATTPSPPCTDSRGEES